MLHLSPEKLHLLLLLLLWILFVHSCTCCWLLRQHLLRSLHKTHIHTDGHIDALSPFLNIRRFFVLSFIRYKFDICMQLKFDDSSCGNPFGTNRARKKANSFERASMQANPRELNRAHFLLFFCRIFNEMRSSQCYNFICKRSAIDWIYCIFIEYSMPVPNLWR